MNLVSLFYSCRRAYNRTAFFHARARIGTSVPVKAKGIKYHSPDQTSGVNWVLFPRSVTPAYVSAWLEAHHWEARDVTCSHDCSGQYFARSPWVRRSGIGTLVTQMWGLDI